MVGVLERPYTAKIEEKIMRDFEEMIRNVKIKVKLRRFLNFAQAKK